MSTMLRLSIMSGCLLVLGRSLPSSAQTARCHFVRLQLKGLLFPGLSET